MNRYNIFKIKKNNRVIQKPKENLKKIQQELIKLYSVIPISPIAHGGIPSRSINTCVSVHYDANYILSLDIKSFYQNVTLEKVRFQLFKYLGLINENIFTKMINQLENCFINIDGKQILPTGAPTSPILSNIACISLDNNLIKLAEEESNRLGCKVNVTRYFDDITFSIFGSKRDWNLISKVENLIESEGYKANKSKTRWETKGSDNLKVVGVIQNHLGEFTIPRSKYREFRDELFNLAKEKKDLTEEAKGMLSYIQSINKSRYEKLINYYNYYRELNE